MMIKKIFKINDYITVKLINNRTVLFVNNKEFAQCIRLPLNIQVDKIHEYDKIRSIDEASELNKHYLIENNIYKEKKGKLVLSQFSIHIDPETEFWAHCSNIEIWAENSYDTCLLHSNIAFPLLKKLTEAGDPQAKNVFSEEIAKRFMMNYIPTMLFLLEENYLSYLSNEEIACLLEDNNLVSEIADYKTVELGNIIYYVVLSLKLESERSYDSLEKICLKLIALENKTKDPSIWYKVGLIFMSLNYRRFAEMFFKKVIILDPHFEGIWSYFGVGYITYGYSETIQRNLKIAELWLWIGKYYEEKGEKNRELYAKKLFFKYGKLTNKLDTKDLIKEHNASEILNYIENLKGHIKEIKNFLPKTIQNQFKDILAEYGLEMYKIWRFKFAIRFFRLSLVFNKNLSYKTWRALGDCYIEVGKFHKAVNSYKNALILLFEKKKYLPDEISENLTIIGNTYLKYGKYDKAVDACTKALKFNRKNFNTWFILSQIFQFKKENKKSKKCKKISRKRYKLEKYKEYLIFLERDLKKYQKRNKKLERQENIFFPIFVLNTSDYSSINIKNYIL